MSKTLLVLCTCPDSDSGRRIASALVRQGLAACINLLPGLVSLYRWQGRLEQSDEVLLLIKTTESRYRELETAIVSLHPYELPEIIGVPVERGLNAYLEWIEQCTRNDC